MTAREPLTKPCARPECDQLVKDETPRRLSRRTCCSKRCAALYRVAQGWTPARHIMAPEVRARACRRAGQVTGQRRRKARALAVVQRVTDVLTPTVFRGLEDRQIAAVKAALARAYLRGRQDGFRSGLDAARRKDKVA